MTTMKRLLVQNWSAKMIVVKDMFMLKTLFTKQTRVQIHLLCLQHVWSKEHVDSVIVLMHQQLLPFDQEWVLYHERFSFHYQTMEGHKLLNIVM
jgi:hypothetical protein